MFKSQERNTKIESPFEDKKGYLGRIVEVVGLELQPQTDWKTGEEKPSKFEVMITVEFPSVRNAEDKPCWLSKRYPFPQSWPDKPGIGDNTNLFKLFSLLVPDMLTQARNPSYYFMDDGIWDELLNQPVYIGVLMTNTGKPKIGSISTVPDFAGEVPPLENPTLLFDVGEATLVQWKSLFPWVRDVISGCENEGASKAAKALNDELEKEAAERRQSNDEGPGDEDAGPDFDEDADVAF